ncbi:DUF885 family protein [Rhodoflexus sp.]
MSGWKWLLKTGLLTAALWLLWYASIFWYKPFAIEDFYERISVRYLLPREAWLTGIVQQTLQPRLILQPKAPTPIRYWEISTADLAADLKVLQSYRREKQNTEQLLSTDVLTWQIQHLIEVDTCKGLEHPFNPFSGVHLLFTERLLLTQTPRNAKEIATYLEQLAGFTTIMAQALRTSFRLDTRCGRQLPCFAAAATKMQLMRFMSVKPVSNPIYLHFRRHLARLETGRDTKQELDAEALLLLETSVYPAFRAMYDYLEKYDCTSLLPPLYSTTDTTQYYEAFHRLSGKTVQPQTLFRYAKQTTDSLSAALAKLLNAPIGAWQPAYQKINETYGNQQGLLGKKSLATALSAAGNYLDTTTLYLFENIPFVSYQLHRMPVVLEGFIPTGKPHPTEAKLLFNPTDSIYIPPAEVMAFAALEMVPGRLMQRQYQRAQNKLPIFRRYWDDPVFTNGWSAYVAVLIAEEAIFESPADRCGLLHRQLIRSAFAVADLGLHLYGWSYNEAVAYLVRHTALPAAEINRKLHHVLLFPAQSCTYLIGCRQLLFLREQARIALGNLFDIRQFHHHILSAGSLPPHLLDRSVKSYITATRKLHP